MGVISGAVSCQISDQVQKRTFSEVTSVFCCAVHTKELPAAGADRAKIGVLQLKKIVLIIQKGTPQDDLRSTFYSSSRQQWKRMRMDSVTR